MKFKVGDIIQRKTGGTKYRVCAVLQNPNCYKTTRLDSGAVWVLFETEDNNYELTEPTGCESTYKVGQVLINKNGAISVGLICDVELGAGNEYHTYSYLLFDRQGKLLFRGSCFQKELLEKFEVSNFKWVVMNGDPKKIVRKTLEARIKEIEEALSEYKTLLDSLTYYEFVLEKENKKSV